MLKVLNVYDYFGNSIASLYKYLGIYSTIISKTDEMLRYSETSIVSISEEEHPILPDAFIQHINFNMYIPYKLQNFNAKKYQNYDVYVKNRIVNDDTGKYLYENFIGTTMRNLDDDRRYYGDVRFVFNLTTGHFEGRFYYLKTFRDKNMVTRVWKWDNFERYTYNIK